MIVPSNDADYNSINGSFSDDEIGEKNTKKTKDKTTTMSHRILARTATYKLDMVQQKQREKIADKLTHKQKKTELAKKKKLLAGQESTMR